MSILDTKKISLIYLIIALFVMNFGFIYELFSHGVYSNYMMYAFLIPLMLGSLVFFIIHIFKINISILSLNFYHCLISTLTIGSIVKGILDIYGTANSLQNIYLYASIILLILTGVFIKSSIK